MWKLAQSEESETITKQFEDSWNKSLEKYENKQALI